MLAANYRTDDPACPPNRSRAGSHGMPGTTATTTQSTANGCEKLANFLHAQQPGCRTRAIVDTAPLLERDFARAAGLGWFGKNTMLINKRQGSWMFLAGLLTDVEFDRRSLRTNRRIAERARAVSRHARPMPFPQPYVLDARKCIAYLTIELKGSIPDELREGIGGLALRLRHLPGRLPLEHEVAPQKRLAFRPRADLNPADLIPLFDWTRSAFERTFGQSALARPGRTAASQCGHCVGKPTRV